MPTGAAIDLKTTYAYHANSWAAQKLAEQARIVGQGLPCQVTEVLIGMVTVKFGVNSIYNMPQVTMPVVTTQYGRAPIQVGDWGRAIPTGVSLAQATGQSKTAPNLGRPFNLAHMAFEPLGNAGWPATPSGGNTYFVYGVNGGGALLMDQVPGPSAALLVSKNPLAVPGTPVSVIAIHENGITLTVPSGVKVKVTAGGTPSPVQTVAGTSTVLEADA